MLNIMIIEGYVRNEPKVMIKEEDGKSMCFFQLAALNPFSRATKYMWVDVVAFPKSEEQLEFFKSALKKDDFITVIGSFSYQKVKGKYYTQVVVRQIDKKFASGSVPTKDIVEQGQAYEDGEEVNW